MTLELTITLIFALCFAASGQSGMLLDPTVGPQPATGFRVAVATPPITASFTFSPASGSWPLTVQFVDTTQGGPGSWAWTFGDGGTSTSQNPTHVFNAPSNTFTVQLTATGPGGSSMVTHSLFTTNAIPIDITLLELNGYRLASPKIRNNGIYNAVLTYPSSGGDMFLLVYDTNTYAKHLIDLSPATFFNMGNFSTFDFNGTNLFMTGGARSGGPGAFHFLISTSSLPSTVTLVTNLTFIDSDVGYCASDVLPNGGYAMAYYDILTNDILTVAYRTPAGMWTNYGKITLNSVIHNVRVAAEDSAVMPGENSWYVFMNKDNQELISAAKFAFDANNLILTNWFVFTDDGTTNGQLQWDGIAPYGEIAPMLAISDSFSNQILLEYENQSITNPPGATNITYQASPGVIAGMSPSTNRYLLMTFDNYVYRTSGSFGMAQNAQDFFIVNASYTVGNNPLAPVPIVYEYQRSGVRSASTNSPYQVALRNTVASDAHSRQVIIQNSADSTWHLLKYP